MSSVVNPINSAQQQVSAAALLRVITFCGKVENLEISGKMQKVH